MLGQTVQLVHDNLHWRERYIYLYFSNRGSLKTTVKDRFWSNITLGDLECSMSTAHGGMEEFLKFLLCGRRPIIIGRQMINYMQELHK